MSQLIALIIAIALGAIVTAIGYVFLGDAFTKNSERGVALQFINQGSQVEMAMTAYRAENAKSAGLVGTASHGFADLQNNDGTIVNSGTATDGLVFQGYLKEGVVAPKGAWTLEQNSTDSTKLVMVSNSADISVNVCKALNKIQNNVEAVAVAADSQTAADALGQSKFRCFADNATATTHIVAYSVE
jgi:hypothetical protein